MATEVIFGEEARGASTVLRCLVSMPAQVGSRFGQTVFMSRPFAGTHSRGTANSSPREWRHTNLSHTFPPGRRSPQQGASFGWIVRLKREHRNRER